MVHYPQKMRSIFLTSASFAPSASSAPNHISLLSLKIKAESPQNPFPEEFQNSLPTIHFSVFLASTQLPLFIFVELSIKMKHYVFK
jgi:hypothetical protein